jgi:uracil-DNA glycosylase
MCEGKCDPQICPKTGDAKHQKNVKHIMSQLGLKPKETFATNLVFNESKNVSKLKEEPVFRDHVDACWLAHKKLLAVVRPTYIVCLGNGKRDSAYSLVREKADEKSGERFSDERIGRGWAFKKFVGKFRLDCGESLEATVVGVLHPSYWQCPPGLVRFIESK